MNIIIIFLILANSVGATFVIDDVPFVGQETQYCGPAALSSVLSFYGDNVDQKTIGKEVYSPGLKGALITDLENYSRKRGFQTKIGRASIADIKEFLLNNKPVIVLVDLGVWVLSRMHYLVVYGYTDRGFLVHDGFKPAQVYSYEEFEKVWQKASNSFLLVYR